LQALGTPRESLFVIAGDDAGALVERIGRLTDRLKVAPTCSLEENAREWYAAGRGEVGSLAVAVVADSTADLRNQLDEVRRSLRHDPRHPVPTFRDRVFYAPEPLGPTGQLAFVFPGSVNDYPGMGRELALRWPEVLRRQDTDNQRLRSQYQPGRFWNSSGQALPREKIFAQVALSTLVSDLLHGFGLRPDAALGYSLGESAALFALRAWTDRDGMLARMTDSPLFTTDLVGSYDAARSAWGLSSSTAVEWLAGVIDCPAARVRAALAEEPRAYLLIVNTPVECVLGGEAAAVNRLVRQLGCRFVPLPEVPATVHCPIARVVADAYRELHRLPTTPPPGVRFYSAALGRVYELTQDNAAEAILAQALDTLDFPALVERAYQDGVRLFVEIGPGWSCSRLISAILGHRAHRARSACVPGTDEVSTVLRLLALLSAERVPLDLDSLYAAAPIVVRSAPGERTVNIPIGSAPFNVPLPEMLTKPDNPVVTAGRISNPSGAEGRIANPFSESLAETFKQTVATQEARGNAHSVYLRYSQSLQSSMVETVAFQMTLLEALVASPDQEMTGKCPAEQTVGTALPPDTPPRSLNRAQCLEFAVGSIGRVLGLDYAAIDDFPTRVRLPDEPLMLVDRITHIDGEPLSLTAGRVVTEHDVQPGAWYLDNCRIPTCIAVEAGQADLFLSGFLGIDLRTRGLAVYRLLDAVVTFHRPLPTPGKVIHYDIRIERFFRQGDTHLFRFCFDGSVDGEPLLTMTNGCAGFFSAEELAAGKGIVPVSPAVSRNDKRRGVQPDDEAELVPRAVETYGSAQIEALRHGDLATAFGPRFADLPLREPLRLPGGRMNLVDRVSHLDPHGGRYGIGEIRGEADIHADDWFLTCHFVDDRVMPGTLMYECCLHTLRIFVMRLGWVGEQHEVVCEPVPGVASQLKCRGQVTESTQTVTYEVSIKERGYRPEPYVRADALMYADGKPIVEIRDMSLQMSGQTREKLRQTWLAVSRNDRQGTTKEPPFGPDRILAFAIGKPSDAFGEPYRVFDTERVIARLPGPPYQFLDRITHIEAEPWKMSAGGVIEAEYDVPRDAWYFAADRQPFMPFAVLLEVALQPCGWLAAYLGSALTSPADLSFRNLGGSGQLDRPVGRDAGTLTTRVTIRRVASSGGMIIQGYEFAVRQGNTPVYRGETTFGFFSRAALAEQVGIRDARLYTPDHAEQARGKTFLFPDSAFLPDHRWRMIDQVDLFVPDGGPHGLGLVDGSKSVDPDAWFFKAHFYQDPVIPGSLGLESLVQLLKVAALHRWPNVPYPHFEVMRDAAHHWLYRGQVVPTNRQVTVQAIVTGCDEGARRLTADGHLLVDGRTVYQMTDFTLTLTEGP
jgi:3-hydroxymyristoyl/3-hydroxydecanoyl-(acyl carrier protein) dehydratase/malonyl CoA-acyl carrier protein transacylase